MALSRFFQVMLISFGLCLSMVSEGVDGKKRIARGHKWKQEEKSQIIIETFYGRDQRPGLSRRMLSQETKKSKTEPSKKKSDAGSKSKSKSDPSKKKSDSGSKSKSKSEPSKKKSSSSKSKSDSKKSKKSSKSKSDDPPSPSKKDSKSGSKSESKSKSKDSKSSSSSKSKKSSAVPTTSPSLYPTTNDTSSILVTERQNMDGVETVFNTQ